MFDLSAATDVLKTFYGPMIVDQLNNGNPLLQAFNDKVKDRMWQGDRVLISTHVGRNQGVGARAETTAAATATLPTPGFEDYARIAYKAKYSYGRCSWTGPAIASMKRDGSVQIEAIDAEMTGLRKSLMEDELRMLHADGTSLLATVTVSAAGNTTTVNSTRFLRVGMRVQFRARTTGATNAALVRTITAIPSATTVTVDGASFTPLTTEGIYRELSRPLQASWATPLEPWGIEALLCDTNPGETDAFTASPTADSFVGEVNRNAAPGAYFKSNMVTANAPFDETLDPLQEAYDASEIEGESEPGLIVTGYRERRIVARQLTTLRRFGDEMTLKGGWKGMAFNNAAIMPDRFAHLTNAPATSAYGRMYLIAPSSLEKLVLQDWKWMDEGGVVVRSGVGTAGVDQFEATMLTYRQYAVLRPNANTVLQNIN